MIDRPLQEQDHNQEQRHEDRPSAAAVANKIVTRGKGVAFASNERAEGNTVVGKRGHSVSMSTSSQSSEDNEGDEERGTRMLSASSPVYTDTLSTSGISAHSTAMTSATTYEEGAPASPPTKQQPPYAQPSLTLLELSSNTASSSALPDSFDVNVSRKGSFIAVYSSSNIWLIKTAQLPRLWARTLQVKRKPIAIDITEDGLLLAVLSRSSQVDLYEIHGEGNGQIKKRRTVSLVHEATSVVVSPDARILITGNKFGIEVVAIGSDVPDTARRTLSGPAGDALEFSDDGRTLLITGYARKSDGSALFVLPGLYDGPLTEEGEPIPQPPEAAWTGSVLFPETARIARQATLLPDADTGTFNELFAFNAEEDSWGVYDIACQRFTQRKMFLPDHQRWTRSEFVDDAMPAVSPNADLAAVALRMSGTTNIWIYEVPGWEYKPNEKAKSQAPIQPCFCIPIPNNDASTLQEVCILRWLRLNADVQRLVAVGNSSIIPGGSDVPGAPSGSKGVIMILDFDKRIPINASISPTPTKTEYDLDPLCPGEMLPEGTIDFEREVELVRTRTLAQRRAQDRRDDGRRYSRIGSTPVQRARTFANRPPQRPSMASDESEELSPEEAQAAFEMPYDNQQPRSQASLARAATVAAVSPANRRHLRALPFRPLEYRRADGHRELPHESDADNWVPPPPAYTATAAAAQSVSLSHPNSPPIPREFRGNPSSVVPPPLPTMSATVIPSQLSPSNPYQVHQPSISSVNLSTPPDHERRPSLVHPSTYPAPQSSASSRRRGSAMSSPQHQMTHMARPNTQSSNASSLASHRRPSLVPHRAAESAFEVRSLPMQESVRRGSAPVVHRVVPPVHDRIGIPPNAAHLRLITSDQSGCRFPLSAPPRTGEAVAYAQQALGQSERASRISQADKRTGKKKIGCTVM